jgi:hypothetical protein
MTRIVGVVLVRNAFGRPSDHDASDPLAHAAEQALATTGVEGSSS